MTGSNGSFVTRESFRSLENLQIPRPKCNGFQFVPTRGRMGFYRSIKRDGSKYGIEIKSPGQRRPALPDLWQNSTEGIAIVEVNNNNLKSGTDRKDFENKYAKEMPTVKFNDGADCHRGSKYPLTPMEQANGSKNDGIGKRSIFRRQAPLSMYTGVRTPIKYAIQEEPEAEYFATEPPTPPISSTKMNNRLRRVEKC